MSVTKEKDNDRLPENFTYEQVKQFVNHPNAFLEDIQAVCMDMADHVDRLRNACYVATDWMAYWLNRHECECEEHHICGLSERQEELRQIKALINGEKQKIYAFPPKLNQSYEQNSKSPS